MICYKDITYCGSKTHKPDCHRQFVADKYYWEWSKSMGRPKGGPVAYADYCKELDK